MKIGGIQTSGSTITSLLGSGSPVVIGVPKQTVVQEYYSGILGGWQLGSNAGPAFNSIPLITNGVQLFSGSITPLFTNSKLVFKSFVNFSSDTQCHGHIFLFVNSVCVKTVGAGHFSAQGISILELEHRYQVTSLSPVTFQLRTAANTSVVLAINDSATAANFSAGGTRESWLKVTEEVFQ